MGGDRNAQVGWGSEWVGKGWHLAVGPIEK